METMDIETWLRGLGLEQYTEAFAENGVDRALLSELTNEDLKDLGVARLADRKKILTAIMAIDPKSETLVPSGEEAAERRQLTVMFCDLVGSTELSQRLDPEELREVMRGYHNAVARTITAHQGHVAKLLGDGVLAYFGWPNAHEDQVEQAVHAALAAAKAVGEIESAGEPLAARAGIATGQVVIGDMIGEAVHERGAVAGETPNLAARLQDLAQPGEVVINDATRRLTGGSFVLEDGGTHQLKGFADPATVWRVTGVVRTGSRFEVAHYAGLTELVGRTHEIGLLLDRWGRALGGEGQVVLVSGEAGIGKSRILREFTTQLASNGHLMLRYQCSTHEVNAAFHPFVNEIETTADLQTDDPAEKRRDKLDAHLASVFGDPGEAAPLIATLLSLPLEGYPLLDMAPQRHKQRTVTALVERIAMLSRQLPVVMIVEDIHWIDASSLEMLDALVERMQDLPVFVVMTYRPEFVPQWGGHGHVTLHSLNRLGRNDGRAIAERITGGKALPDEVLSRILEQTDGIPLYVEELTKTVLEASFLEEQADRYVLNGPLPTVEIPATLHDSLMARLDRLAPVKRVIQAAACIGREFGAGLLAAALPMGPAELENALGQLLAAQLIFRHGDAESATYIFKHALVQDAAYASLLAATQRSIHERLALALEQTGDPDPLALARHFSVAGANQRASQLFLATGRRSLEGSALPEAIGSLELGLQEIEAIASSSERDRLELDLRVALGTARMANFGWAHASVSEALEPAFPLATAFGDMDALGSILWGLWVHYQTRGNFPRAHEWLAELEAAARGNKESDLPVVYEMSAGCQYFWEADYLRAIGHTDRLRKIYDPKQHAHITAVTNHDPLVFSQHWAGSLAEWIRGHPGHSLERLNEAMTLARKIGHPFNLVFSLTAGATSLIYLDDADRLLEYCNEAAKVAVEEALGPFSENVNIKQWRGGAHIQRGEFAIGHPLIEAGNHFWTISGGKIATAMFRSWIVLGLQGLGRIDEASLLNAANIAHCRETGDCYMEPECVRLQGELALQAQKPDIAAAERSFREAIAIAEAHGAKSWELRAAMSLAKLLLSRDRRTDAVECLEPVLNWFTGGLETEDFHQAGNLMATMA